MANAWTNFWAPKDTPPGNTRPGYIASNTRSQQPVFSGRDTTTPPVQTRSQYTPLPPIQGGPQSTVVNPRGVPPTQDPTGSTIALNRADPNLEGYRGAGSSAYGQPVDTLAPQDPTIQGSDLAFGGDAPYGSETRPGVDTETETYTPPTAEEQTQVGSDQSGWETGAQWVTALGGAAQGYAALEGVDIARDQFGLAKETTTANLQAQSAALGNEIGNDEYARLRNRGMSEEDARAGASAKVAGANLPTNLSGGSFQWT